MPDQSRTAKTQKRLAAARGEHPVDVLFTGGNVVNVYTGRIENKSIAVYDGIIVGTGEYNAYKIVDLEGAYLVPGFIDGHIHIESSKLIPSSFSAAVTPHGTTAVVSDPHEIANVLGVEGIRFMLRSSENTTLDFFYMLPSCVPATNMETSGAVLRAEDLKQLLEEPSVLGVGEMMNFPGTISGEQSVLDIIELSDGRLPVDGHAPGLTGKNLSAYILAGPSTDHECTTIEEAAEKLSNGMRVMIREGSIAKNLETLLPLVTPGTERRFMFVSDDVRPGDLLHHGHLDHILRKAVKLGLDPVTAIRMVTLNPAEAFGLTSRGGIRPGLQADLVIIDNLRDFKVQSVFKAGRRVAQDGYLTVKNKSETFISDQLQLNVPPVSVSMFHVKDEESPVRVIGIVPGQIITKYLERTLLSSGGLLVPNIHLDIIKVVVVERYSGKGHVGIGFVEGMGLQKGAIASTVAHDSHNIIACGVDDESLVTAVSRLVEIGGGQVVCDGSAILAELPLPVAGLMSDEPAGKVSLTEELLIHATRQLECKIADPFMTLSFLALPVIPELKLTDHGLVDVRRFEEVSLYVRE